LSAVSAAKEKLSSASSFFLSPTGGDRVAFYSIQKAFFGMTKNNNKQTKTPYKLLLRV